jgi:hypothetical protein
MGIVSRFTICTPRLQQTLLKEFPLQYPIQEEVCGASIHRIYASQTISSREKSYQEP